MANLVCWASGLLEVLPNSDTPMDSGPVVLLTGRASRINTLMTAHGAMRSDKGVIHWYVPGTKPVPKDPDEAAVVQRDNMTLVIAFTQKLRGEK